MTSQESLARALSIRAEQVQRKVSPLSITKLELRNSYCVNSCGQKEENEQRETEETEYDKKQLQEDLIDYAEECEEARRKRKEEEKSYRANLAQQLRDKACEKAITEVRRLFC